LSLAMCQHAWLHSHCLNAWITVTGCTMLSYYTYIDIAHLSSTNCLIGGNRIRAEDKFLSVCKALHGSGPNG